MKYFDMYVNITYCYKLTWQHLSELFVFAAPLVCSRNLVLHCTWILQTKLCHTPEHTNGTAKNSSDKCRYV